ncbi:MAG: hypothetical protein ABUU24_03365, partial [Variovorax sp.]
LTDFGRARHLSLREIPYCEAARIYEAMAAHPFPLDAKTFAEVTSPEYMVFGRKGAGGPQIAEVNRMLSRQREAIAADRAWTQSRRAQLSHADARLDAAVEAIANGTAASIPTIPSNPETTR